MVDINDKAPDFKVLNDQEQTVSLKDYRGKKLVLYFYPKDNTSGCTTEACEFQAQLAKFRRAGVEVVGVSKDPVKSHIKFKEKYDLKFPLLADVDTTLCQSYGVLVEKSMYGKKYLGIERSTFLIDEKGKIRQVWRKVKVDGHVEEVLAAAKAL
ncbi:MAG: hypothetical protein Tsb005_09780 [Gammaproteobacteria bacterium]